VEEYKFQHTLGFILTTAPDITSCAVPIALMGRALWHYYRFNPSRRDIKGLLAEPAIAVSREAFGLCCIQFGSLYDRRLQRKQHGYGDTICIGEVFAGVPDHSEQWHAALSLESHRRCQ